MIELLPFLAAFKWRKVLAVLGAIAYVGATYVAVYYGGRMSAQAECDSAKLAAELQKSRADVARLQRSAEAQEIQTKFLQATRETFDGRIQSLEQELDNERKKPIIVEHAAPATCPVPSRDDRANADDLRKLRGVGPDN